MLKHRIHNLANNLCAIFSRTKRYTYKHLSQCKDYKLLKSRYPDTILFKIETSIAWWKEALVESHYTGFEHIVMPEAIKWYEGWIETEVFCAFLDEYIREERKRDTPKLAISAFNLLSADTKSYRMTEWYSMAIDAIDRCIIAKKPTKEFKAYDKGYHPFYACPACELPLDETERMQHCYSCGQKLDWEGVE